MVPCLTFLAAFSFSQFFRFFFLRDTSQSKSPICVLQERIFAVTALSPQLEQLSAEARSLGAVPSQKDTVVVVSAHHASTLQQLENANLEFTKGILAK